MGKACRIAAALAAAAAATAAAFDWPQNQIMSDTFFSYFGQLRGGGISPSLVFSDTEVVKAADKGRLIAVISEHGDGELFESTLGNAAVVAHADDMLTVYANLDSAEPLRGITEVEAGQELGESTNSGWQEGDSCLEFQVVDTQNRSFVNPRLLMPRFGDELPLVLSGVTAVNKAGTPFRLATTKVLNAGTYLVYGDRQDVAVPYKTAIYINGAAVETMSFDSVHEVEGRLCIKGRGPHGASEVYPDGSRILLGEAQIPRGRNEMTVVITDILGKEQSMSYIFDAR